MICEDCTKTGRKSLEVFTKIERMYVLTSAAAMLRSVENAGDKAVANSVVTKMLLSFDELSRHTIKKMIKESLGMEITLNSCPHGKQLVV